MELIRLRGTPDEIGKQHGELLRARIGSTWEFYSQALFGNRIELLEELGSQYLGVIRAFSAEYADEIEAIASGAGLSSWQIAVLNARTEILHCLTALDVGECTAMYLPGTRILGQNWDWMRQLESLIVVLQIERADGHRILQMTEPGIIGKIGLNSKGLGVCLNIVLGQASPTAVPVHIMLRTILDSDTIDEALTRLSNAQGTCSNILLADDQGRAVDLELAGMDSAVVDYAEATPVHTNHYLSRLRERHSDVEALANSNARFSRASKLVEQLGSDAGAPELKSILKDTGDATHPICRRYVPSDGHMVGTVASVVMDLPARKLQVTKGHPGQSPYREFPLI